MRKIQLVDNTKIMLLDYKKQSEPDVQKLLSSLGNTATSTNSGEYYFYCAECECKTKMLLYYKTWCPCKESQVIATLFDIEYLGMAVTEEDWNEMEDKSGKAIINFPTVTDLM